MNQAKVRTHLRETKEFKLLIVRNLIENLTPFVDTLTLSVASPFQKSQIFVCVNSNFVIGFLTIASTHAKFSILFCSNFSALSAIFNDFACTSHYSRYKRRRRHVGHTLKGLTQYSFNVNPSLFYVLSLSNIARN